MRMRALVLALLAVVGTTVDIEAQCANYISSGQFDDPFFGELLGQQQVEETVSVDAELSLKSTGFSGTRTRTTSYWVGHYRDPTGAVRKFDCRDYTLL